MTQTRPTSVYENDYFDIHSYENMYNHQYYGSLDDEEQWRIEELNGEDSENVLLNYRECLKMGTFLIRKSVNNQGQLTLCFL
jgi:hypothetical protein